MQTLSLKLTPRTWNTLLWMFAESGDLKALNLCYQDMTRADIKPDVFTLTYLMLGFVKKEKFSHAIKHYRQLTKVYQNLT